MVDAAADSCLCTALRQASRRVSQHYDAALAPAGLSANQFSILVRLARCGPASLQALAKDLVMDRSTLGHLLRPLEERGLVTLIVPACDRRRREITLQPAGAALIDTARPLWCAAQERFEASYGPAAAHTLRADLHRICITEPAHVRQP